MVKTKPLQRADFEVLDHDIGVDGETANCGTIGLATEISRDRSLAPVASVEICGGCFSAIVWDERRSPLAGIIALAFSFHLHHVGAQIRKELSAPGTGEDSRQFQHSYSDERLRAFFVASEHRQKKACNPV
jgi:hypothetical protein